MAEKGGLGDFLLLVLGQAEKVPPIDRGGGGGGPSLPSKATQVERLDPKFAELKRVLDAHNAVIATNPGAASPEQVLVFETVGSAADFLAAVQASPNLDWLVEHEGRMDPDEYFHAGDSKRQLTTCLYMVAFNLRALDQLLSVWTMYKTTQRLPAGHGHWGQLFRCLRDVRRWGPEDRLREAGLLQQLFETDLTRQVIPVEVELWSRSTGRREAAENRIRELIESARGAVLDAASVPEIGYHALLAELPRAYVGQLLSSKDVDLIQADEIYLLRPTAQCAVRLEYEPKPLPEEARRPQPSGEPLGALLDGLPMENHPQLRGRLIVDDPDGWAGKYQVADRKHGTAMASLMINGDLAENATPLEEPLYSRPILRVGRGDERAPSDRLWLDLVHQAIRRIVATDGPYVPVAPSVRVINISVGDPGRPFHFSPSPLARLLDWLAYKYQLLFVVSAGNHDGALPASCEDDVAAVRHIFGDGRHRRLLSPAESINALTVGSLNLDSSQPLSQPHQRIIPERPHLPAAYSGVGRGVRQSVKPDVLAPGGRRAFRRRLPSPDAEWEPVGNPEVGQLVAVPGPPGASQVARTSGTSNAAALTSRAAIDLLKVANRLRGEHAGLLGDVAPALLTKALLVHAAEWPHEMFEFVHSAVKGLVDPSRAKDRLAAMLGYGVVRAGRSERCSSERATAVAGGSLVANEGAIHRFPVPASLHLHRGWRRLTATLAWFSPINPHDRRYRRARLHLRMPKDDRSPLLLGGGQVHADATVRGTVQHVVLEQDESVINLLGETALDVTVSCFEDAGEFTEPIPYALVLSLEVAPGIALPIYTEVAQRLRVPVQTRVSE
ncbi:MAG TPA: S8 family peptidase [Polyangiaceae bacterium]|nr:S8 family peptidase [Polyangiaceae bacterium]